MIRIILFISLVLPLTANATEPQSNLLNYIPSLIAASHTPTDSLPPTNPLVSGSVATIACKDGQIIDGWSMYEVINSHSKSITVVKMEIIDPSTWQFAQSNTLPITLAPGDSITYTVTYIESFLCENWPTSVLKLLFTFSDGTTQTI